MSAPMGCSKDTTLMGATYLRIHYSADPQKDAVWAARERAEMPQREWEREMEMNEHVYDGEPVFADYRDKWHAGYLDARTGQPAPLPLIRNSVYFGGWDAGQTLSPAFTLLQVTPTLQVMALLEVLPGGPMPMETFAPLVGRALAKRLPGQWDEIEHWGDGTITTRDGSVGMTAQQIARKHGFRIREASNEWNPRYSAVTWLLVDSIDEATPRFLIDPVLCPVLRTGFQGAYKYENDGRGEAVGPGRILKMPLKNSYSHIQDALQYPAIAIQRRFRQQQERRKSRLGA